MSVTVVQQPPPAVAVTEEPFYNSHTTHASIAPLIAVLSVIIILGIVAAMIGRLCTGRKVMGVGQFDIESWIETKCSSCIDGRIYPPPPPPRSNASSATSVLTPIEGQPQQEDQCPQTPTT
ncbi:hypothetical protein HRI_005205800 [Hibiscus trionum]|uniref:Transmembrane protein n=1 Tax=Hibiscus trionum TaxID=183268 RepID=A0A9W7JGZ6_HIBTR|nr:hypothetical protein HRI_005205800 [Hibiscus trionum]